MNTIISSIKSFNIVGKIICFSCNRHMYFGGAPNVLIKLKLDSRIVCGVVFYTIESEIVQICVICSYTNLQIF